jgi:hypothetical protein
MTFLTKATTKFYFKTNIIKMKNEFPKKYSPKEFENELYSKWEKN